MEHKTTIPILSNFLPEADGDRIVITATDLDQSIRTCDKLVGKSLRCELGDVDPVRVSSLRSNPAG